MPDATTKQMRIEYATWERARRFLAASAARGRRPESLVSLVTRAVERELNRLKAPQIDQEAA